MTALKAPFLPEDIDFRAIQWSKDGSKALAFAYIDARAVMDRLDEVFGMNWSVETMFCATEVALIPGQVSMQAEISIPPLNGMGYIKRTGYGSGAVLTSDRGVTNEPIKSAESDAIKRAGMALGIGRYLYSLPHIWLDWSGDRSYGNFTEDPRGIFFNADGTTKDSAIARDSKRNSSSKPVPETSGISTPAPTASTQSYTRGASTTTGNRNAVTQGFATYLAELGLDGMIAATILDTCTNLVSVCPTPSPSAAQIKYVVGLCEKNDEPYPDFSNLDKNEAQNMIKTMVGN